MMTLITAAFRDGDRVVTWSHLEGEYAAVTSLVFTGTLAIPTLVVMLMLAFMLIARLLLSAGRSSLMYYFDLATEKSPKEFMPATLFGIALALFIATIKCIWQIITMIHR
jgi:hypothetical protein